jgi:hypothetical protein
MRQLAYASAWTGALAVVGYYLGSAVHGASVRAIICAVAGGLGGFGIAGSSLDVLRRWRERLDRAAGKAA